MSNIYLGSQSLIGGGGMSINNFLKNPVSIKGKSASELYKLRNTLKSKALFVAYVDNGHTWFGYINQIVITTTSFDGGEACGTGYELYIDYNRDKCYLVEPIWVHGYQYQATNELDMGVTITANIWYGDLPF